MVDIGDIIDVMLLPKNEAEYPESAKVKLKAKLPIGDKELFVGELLYQTKQDFGFIVGEFIMVHVTNQDGKVSAFCSGSMQEQSV
jgi:hypothetical protein